MADAGATRCALEALADPAVLPPSVPLCYEPTSALKAEVATFPEFLQRLNLLTPAEDEVVALAEEAWRCNPLARGPLPKAAGGKARADIASTHALALLAAMQPVEVDPGELVRRWQQMREAGTAHVRPSQQDLRFEDLASHKVLVVTMAEAGALVMLSPAGPEALRGPPHVVMAPARRVANTVNSTGAGTCRAPWVRVGDYPSRRATVAHTHAHTFPAPRRHTGGRHAGSDGLLRPTARRAARGHGCRG